MMEKHIIPPVDRKQLTATSLLTPNRSKPVWVAPQMNCDQCNFNQQDIDTFPCAKCHTRD